MTRPDTLIEDCLTWIATVGSVSFAELVRWLGGRGVDVRGGCSIKPLPNGVVWAGVSERFCGIFDQIRHRVTLEPADDTCACDGMLRRRQPPRLTVRGCDVPPSGGTTDG